jgi:hypothetical protein
MICSCVTLTCQPVVRKMLHHPYSRSTQPETPRKYHVLVILQLGGRSEKYDDREKNRKMV